MEICTSKWEVFLVKKKELRDLIVKYKEDYDKEIKNLDGKIHYDYKRKKHVPMKPKQGFYTTSVVFNSVYFSPRLNISFELSIYQVRFLNLENLFSRCFSTFVLFHKLQLYSYIGKVWYIYVIEIKMNKPPSFILTPCLYFTWFSNLHVS